MVTLGLLPLASAAALCRTRETGGFVRSHPFALLPMTPLHNPSPSDVSARGAAALLGVSRDRIARLIFRGIIPATAVGRTYCIRRGDLERVRGERPDLFPEVPSAA